jgi:Cof subfamily protein (haloacid dehalogenase superfamily)
MSTLYVSDLDGTLLGDDGRLSGASRTVINDLVAQGMLFTVATGRSLPPTELVLRGLDLRQPIICMNGALIVDPRSREVVRQVSLDPARAEALVRGHLARGLHPFVFTIDRHGEHHAYHLGIFNEVERRYVAARLALGDRRFRVVDDLASAFDDEVMTVVSIDTPERVDPVYHAFAGDSGLYQVRSVDDREPAFRWLETLNADANKGAAVRLVRDRLGADRLVCFGDQANDVPMFEAADEAYAVAGAQEALRALATATIGSHRDDAVARYLRTVWSSSTLPG